MRWRGSAEERFTRRTGKHTSAKQTHRDPQGHKDRAPRPVHLAIHARDEEHAEQQQTQHNHLEQTHAAPLAKHFVNHHWETPCARARAENCR